MKIYPVYRCYLDRRPSELAELVPLFYSWERSTCYSDRLRNFSVTILGCYKDVYASIQFRRERQYQHLTYFYSLQIHEKKIKSFFKASNYFQRDNCVSATGYQWQAGAWNYAWVSHRSNSSKEINFKLLAQIRCLIKVMILICLEMRKWEV